MNKKSIAFFDLSTTPHMSKCKLCDSLVTRGGKSLKSYGTTATRVGKTFAFKPLQRV